MAQSGVINSLVSKYGDHQKQRQGLAEQLTQLDREIEALGTCIKLYDASYPLVNIKGKRKNRKIPGFQQGEISRMVSEYVRTAHGAFVNADAAANIIEKKSGHIYSSLEIDKITHRVSGALKRLESKKIVEQCGRKDHKAILWRRVS